MKTNIQTILLDLGVVLLDIEFGPALEQIQPLCDPRRAHLCRKFFSLTDRDPAVHEHETGRLAGHDYYRRFQSVTGFGGNYDRFVDLWRSIFRENRPMLDLGQRLSAQYPVHFLTNAGDLHVPWVFDRFPSLRFYKQYACSAYLGALKPDLEFYQRAMQWLKLDPATCLFIDDRPENADTARIFGLNTILYESAEQAIADVRKLVDFT